MTSEEAAAWLDSLESLGIRPGLDRITALLARLGDPHRDFPSVLITGTNGKGSVASFLAAILERAGIDPGVYTSPHLVRFEERIRVGKALIGSAELAALTAEVQEAAEAVHRDGGAAPTYFEATTAIAFLHFSRRRVPLAVLEVGMGGRYDATNVVGPSVCAITAISLDHTEWLGRTVAEIAAQKAGIIKPGVPVAVARQETEAMEVIRAEAARLQAPLLESERCDISGRQAGDPPRFSLVTPSGRRYESLTLSLRGDHQIENACLAVLLAEQLRDGGLAAIDDQAIAGGLAGAVWPGRLELLPGTLHGPGDEPPGGVDLLLDGAHNPAGAATLARYLARHQSGRPRRVLVFGAMRDKPAGAMLALLKPVVDEIVVTALPLPRGTPPLELEALARETGLPVRCEPDPGLALERGRAAAGRGGLVIASGSLYLVGEIKRRSMAR